MELIRETPYRWRIPRQGAMRVPGIVYASRSLLPEVAGDQALDQVRNVAALPGIVGASHAMPDVHWGYGFPIGGVAATDPGQGGVVSPGGVGFDISCGVRLLVSRWTVDDLRPHLNDLMAVLGRSIPRGLGRKRAVWRPAGPREVEEVLVGGARYAVERGFGEPRDLDHCEDFGAVADADPAQVSSRAVERGLEQVGSLGSGNHFLEVQAVDAVSSREAALAFGLAEGRVCVLIHTGSRGLGHQVCTDHVRDMQAAMDRYRIDVPDRQLACAPVDSPEGQRYLGAMAAGANFSRANRQLLTHAARRAFEAATGDGQLDLLYDVSHNLAKLERHTVDGEERLLCVHRKGAIRAFPPGHPELPPRLRRTGQPLLVPGSMGTASWVLAGGTDAPAFASACHGAGRTMSRHQAVRRVHGKDLARRLEDRGILVRGETWRGLAEETPEAYKDVDEVVGTCVAARMASKVARLVPLGVVKG